MNAKFKESQAQAADARTLEASDWILRLQGADVDEQTTAQWLEWCQAHNENLSTFERIRSLWHKFDDKRLSTSLSLELKDAPLGEADKFDDKQLSDSLVFSGAPRAAIGRGRFDPVKSWAKPMRIKLSWALAASLIVAVGTVAWIWSQQVNPVLYAQTLNTAIASLSRQTLPDGSTVELGARSSVRVELTKERRAIFIDDGEAFFQVAKDPSRPFVVQAGDLQVIAVGTAFNVRKAQDRVIVTVKEGTVRVTPNSAAALPAESSEGQVRAGAGHQVTYSTRQQSLTMTTVEPIVVAVAAKSSSWQVGRLEFVNEPLSSVITDANRYSTRPIVLKDEKLGSLIFTGTLRSDAIDDWLSGLKDVFPVEVVDKGEQGILLTQRPARTSP